jgi:hypothetical protein
MTDKMCQTILFIAMGIALLVVLVCFAMQGCNDPNHCDLITGNPPPESQWDYERRHENDYQYIPAPKR